MTDAKAIGDSAPDWAKVTEDIHCPLCDYNLRGLIEPRCPECGYRFQWSELSDPARRKHPYLFEHHPESNFRSLWKTAWHGLRPGRFWRSLNPAQPSRPRRLMIYWSLAVFLSLGLFVAIYGRQVATVVQTPTMTLRAAPGPRLLGVPAYRSWNILRDPGFHRYIFSRATVRLAALSTLGYFLWPWLTFLVLMIFSQSMRRARVRPIHVLRCLLYSADAGLWLGVTFLPLMALAIAASLLGFWPKAETLVLWAAMFLMIYGLLPIMSWRLGQAYRLYLRFDHPFLTILAAQFILVLATYTAAFSFVAWAT